MIGREPSARWLRAHPKRSGAVAGYSGRGCGGSIRPLTAAKVPGPYVLVGHSMGGMIARLVASEHGDEVAAWPSRTRSLKTSTAA